jgi:hypothetical protein
MTAALRTLSELVADIATAMADWPDIGNGQIRSVPDERTLRSYATLGLLDRPLSWRGRTALYGTRHRWQVLAIKRLQSAQWPLTAIQAHLLGVDDARLREVVANPGVPPDVTPAAADATSAPASPPTAEAADAPPAPGDPAAPAAAAAQPATSAPALNAPATRAPAPPAEATRTRRASAFWSAPMLPPSQTRVHVDCGLGAELVLPIGMTADVELTHALAPLRAWLHARQITTVPAPDSSPASPPSASPPPASPPPASSPP